MDCVIYSDRTLLVYSMECTGQNITYLLKGMNRDGTLLSYSMESTGRNITDLLKIMDRDGTLFAYSMECTGQTITYLLNGMYRKEYYASNSKILLVKRLWTDRETNGRLTILEVH